jgi:hypothetical protein
MRATLIFRLSLLIATLGALWVAVGGDTLEGI